MLQFTGHAYSGYDTSVQSLLAELGTMAKTVDSLLAMLAQAISGEAVSSNEAKDLDKEVNQLEYDVIGHLHGILGKYSPSVDELRFLISTVRIAAGLEHIGDIAKVNIKRHSYAWGENETLPEPFRTNTLSMLETTRNMLVSSLENVTSFNSERLKAVLEQDAKVDELYVNMMDQLKNSPATDPKLVAKYNAILILIKDIERAADHSFEVGRIAYFAHTGSKPRKKNIRTGNI